MTTPVKADLRRACIARRRTLRESAPGAAEAVAVQVAALLAGAISAGKTVAGYMTIGDELDCRPVLARLDAAGARLALPVARGPGEPLVFRLWKPGAAMERGPLSTSHPHRDAPEVVPEIVLVPLVAFDRAGHRLGFGAGYYDRTLAGLRAGARIAAVGLAYDGQEVAAIPAEPTDARLDAVVTEARVLRFTEHPGF